METNRLYPKEMYKKIILLLNTVKYLKPIQIFYQIYYRFKKRESYIQLLPSAKDVSFVRLKFRCNVKSREIIKEENRFVFLNLDKKFGDQIDWNFMDYGKLWYYNLHYFDFLFQENISDEIKIGLIKDYNRNLENNFIVLESYPIALRVINGIRYFSQERLEMDSSIATSYYTQLLFLSKNLEFDILGNHLLENAFALLMGGYAFNNEVWKKKGNQLLKKELNRQVLNDGAHFELSPMYHKIMLFRVLEVIDWYENGEDSDSDFLSFMKDKAIKMLNWLYTISFCNGEVIPHFNDSSEGITYSNNQLFFFARLLGLSEQEKVELSDSGYRVFNYATYQCVVDVSNIKATYQPGHTHADVFSFFLYYSDKPLFVEVGTSTYQKDSVRDYERSTIAHNTVVVNNTSQYEVWSGFRVGKRANIFIENESDNHIFAYHDGYKKYKITHRRNFIFENDKIIISDILIAPKNREYQAKAYFHFHPDRAISREGDVFIVDGKVRVTFDKIANVSIGNYNHAIGYNLFREGKVLEVTFEDELNTTIFI